MKRISEDDIRSIIVLVGRDGAVSALATSKRLSAPDLVEAAKVEIAERERAEQGLQQSENRYRRLVELSPEPIFVHIEGNIVYVNSATARLVGAADPEELVAVSRVACVGVHATSHALGDHKGRPYKI